MDFQVSIADSGKYLICRVYVPVTREVAHSMAIELNRLAEESGVDGRLIDVRGSRNAMSVLNNYDLAYRDMDELNIKRETKVAALVDPGDSNQEFVLNAIRNAGFNLRVFHDEAPAIVWLEE